VDIFPEPIGTKNLQMVMHIDLLIVWDIHRPSLLPTMDWHGFTKPTQVTGMGNDGYGCGYGFAYP